MIIRRNSGEQMGCAPRAPDDDRMSQRVALECRNLSHGLLWLNKLLNDGG